MQMQKTLKLNSNLPFTGAPELSQALVCFFATGRSILANLPDSANK
jgi:hypothetical protein